MCYELSDSEWAAIKPFLPNKSRGVRRVNDRRMLNGIFWVLRSGAPWRDLPICYGPRTTCYNRFVQSTSEISLGRPRAECAGIRLACDVGPSSNQPDWPHSRVPIPEN